MLFIIISGHLSIFETSTWLYKHFLGYNMVQLVLKLETICHKVFDKFKTSILYLLIIINV
jgi:hypothetical protein